MKTKFLLLLLVSSSFFIGCKESKKEEVKEENVSKSFVFSVNVISPRDDIFSLYFTEDGTTDFMNEPISMHVKGSEEPQDVVFELPEEAIPTEFRLDVCMPDRQNELTINGFKMIFMGKEFSAPKEQFSVYFNPDLSKTIYDKETGNVKAVVKEGIAEYPSFYPHAKPMSDEINKLLMNE